MADEKQPARQPQPTQIQIPQLLQGPNEIYFNGFGVAVGNGDIRIVLTRNNKGVAGLNCSYEVAKTLAEQLAVTINGLEEVIGSKILTVQSINSAMEKQMKVQDKK